MSLHLGLASRQHGTPEQDNYVINLYSHLNVSGCLVPSGHLDSMPLCNASGSTPYFDQEATQALVPNSTAYFCALPRDHNTPAALSGLIGNYSVVPINMLGCIEMFSSGGSSGAAAVMCAPRWLATLMAVGWLAAAISVV